MPKFKANLTKGKTKQTRIFQGGSASKAKKFYTKQGYKVGRVTKFGGK